MGRSTCGFVCAALLAAAGCGGDGGAGGGGGTVGCGTVACSVGQVCCIDCFGRGACQAGGTTCTPLMCTGGGHDAGPGGGPMDAGHGGGGDDASMMSMPDGSTPPGTDAGPPPPMMCGTSPPCAGGQVCCDFGFGTPFCVDAARCPSSDAGPTMRTCRSFGGGMSFGCVDGEDCCVTGADGTGTCAPAGTCPGGTDPMCTPGGFGGCPIGQICCTDAAGRSTCVMGDRCPPAA